MDLDESFESMVQHAKLALGNHARRRGQVVEAKDLLLASNVEGWVADSKQQRRFPSHIVSPPPPPVSPPLIFTSYHENHAASVTAASSKAPRQQSLNPGGGQSSRFVSPERDAVFPPPPSSGSGGRRGSGSVVPVRKANRDKLLESIVTAPSPGDDDDEDSEKKVFPLLSGRGSSAIRGLAAGDRVSGYTHGRLDHLGIGFDENDNVVTVPVVNQHRPTAEGDALGEALKTQAAPPPLPPISTASNNDLINTSSEVPSNAKQSSGSTEALQTSPSHASKPLPTPPADANAAFRDVQLHFISPYHQPLPMPSVELVVQLPNAPAASSTTHAEDAVHVVEGPRSPLLASQADSPTAPPSACTRASAGGGEPSLDTSKPVISTGASVAQPTDSGTQTESGFHPQKDDPLTPLAPVASAYIGDRRVNSFPPRGSNMHDSLAFPASFIGGSPRKPLPLFHLPEESDEIIFIRPPQKETIDDRGGVESRSSSVGVIPPAEFRKLVVGEWMAAPPAVQRAASETTVMMSSRPIAPQTNYLATSNARHHPFPQSATDDVPSRNTSSTSQPHIPQRVYASFTDEFPPPPSAPKQEKVGASKLCCCR